MWKAYVDHAYAQNLAKPPLMRICREFENRRVLRALSGKFLRQKSCYPESFRFLWLCLYVHFWNGHSLPRALLVINSFESALVNSLLWQLHLTSKRLSQRSQQVVQTKLSSRRPPLSQPQLFSSPPIWLGGPLVDKCTPHIVPEGQGSQKKPSQ